MALEQCLEIIREKIGDPQVQVGLILGSGLGHLASAVDGVAIDYNVLPGFPHTGVSGHNPKLFIGELEGIKVAVLGGRAHFYENGQADVMRLPISVLAALGSKHLFLTNAAGSLKADMKPGELMLITDHINFSGRSPLIGELTDKRFVNMTHAYDPMINEKILELVRRLEIPMHSGVYAWYSGPNFETPAEIRALQVLGAHAVGMSTVPEVILGRFFNLKCTAVSVITNMAAGLSDENISHEHTKSMAPLGAQKLEEIIRAYLRGIQ